VEQPTGIRGADQQQSGPPHPPGVDQKGLKEGHVAMNPMPGATSKKFGLVS